MLKLFLKHFISYSTQVILTVSDCCNVFFLFGSLFLILFLLCEVMLSRYISIEIPQIFQPLKDGVLCFVVVQLPSHVQVFLLPTGLQPTWLLCSWDSLGKNIEGGCHFLLQWIFLTQGFNSCVLHRQGDSSPPSQQGSPLFLYMMVK